jgi:hypothetical protein
MKRFDSKGMLVIPNPIKAESICKHDKVIVVKECYCQEGHNLISDKAIFNGFNGIILKVVREDQEGLVALSPVYGYKSRVAMNVELKEGEIWTVLCPICNKPMPAYDQCDCGGDLICLFLDKKANYSNCICICNRIDCFNAGIKYGEDLLNSKSLDAL